MQSKFWVLLMALLLFTAFQYSKSPALLYPSHIPKPHYNFTERPLSTEKVSLGRTLFYDPILSKDNSISCASCHSPYNAFAHTDHDLSHGIDDQIGTRNAPALFNLAWQDDFMWDGKIHDLDVQAKAPITSELEMGENLANVALKLSTGTFYRDLFKSAFGDTSITEERILKALAQFQLTLTSFNSKYDRMVQGLDSFTEQENNGYQLFKKNCNSCHSEPLFFNGGYANNGIPMDTTLNDKGKWEVTHLSADSLKFKIPTLRNLSFSFPYMHDGRFIKLSEIINHYTDAAYQLSPVANDIKTPIKLSAKEKIDLISFILTLDDREFILNPENKFPKSLLRKNEGSNK